MSGTIKATTSIEAVSATASVIAISWVIFCAICIWQRMPFGISFTDESYYLATALAFMRGEQPFISILGLHQASALLSAFLLTPLQLLNGGTEGLMLLARQTYLALSIVTAICCFIYLRRLVSISSALILSSLVIAFIPFGLPNLSYNTLGMLFYIAGVTLAMHSISIADSRLIKVVQVIASLCFLLAVFSHVVMLVPTAIFMIFAVSTNRHKYTHGVRAMHGIIQETHGDSPTQHDPDAITHLALQRDTSTGSRTQFTGILWSFISLFVAGIIYLIFTLGWRQLTLNCAFSLAFSMHSPSEKIAHIAEQFVGFAMSHYSLYPAIVFALLLKMASNSKWTIIYACGFLLSVAAIYLQLPVLFIESHDLTFFIALCGLIIFLPWQKAELQVNRSLLTIFCASFLGGLATSYSTSINGLFNFCIAGFACSLATFTQIVIWLENKADDLQLSARHLLSAAFGCASAGIFLYTSCTFCYGELSRSDCTHPVEQGIFRGLFSTAEKVNYISNVENALAPLAKRYRTICVIGDPGAYLLSSLLPQAPTLNSDENRWYTKLAPFFSAYYSQPNRHPDVILIVPKATKEQPSATELSLLHALPYELVPKKDPIMIYTLNRRHCSFP